MTPPLLLTSLILNFSYYIYLWLTLFFYKTYGNNYYHDYYEYLLPECRPNEMHDLLMQHECNTS